MSADRKRPWFRVAEAALVPLLRAAAARHWRGSEHIPRRGGVIVATNHISYLDPVTFGHFVRGAGRVPHFLAKAELFAHPVIGRMLTGTDMIPVHRGAENAGVSAEAACAAVRRGHCIIVYPEATITRDPGLWPMVGKTGAARIALETGAPVIPVAQWGAHRILAPYATRPHLWPRRTVYARAGRPVDLGGFAAAERTPELLAAATEAIMAAITVELEIIRAERAPSVRFDPHRAGVAPYGDPRGTDPLAAESS